MASVSHTDSHPQPSVLRILDQAAPHWDQADAAGLVYPLNNMHTNTAGVAAVVDLK